MSTRVYLKERLPNNPREGYTCVHQDTAQLRDRQSLHHRLQQAYRRDDARLVRRSTVLIDILVHHVPWRVCERWASARRASMPGKGLSLHGLDSLVYCHTGGRPEVDPASEETLGTELIDAGPLVVGVGRPVGMRSYSRC